MTGSAAATTNRPSPPTTPASLIARYDRRVPRYTSYPTALQFGPDVDAAIYEEWLAALPAGEAVSLYLHIPFCQRLCWYCGCNTRVVRRREPMGDYVELLRREISMTADRLPKAMRAAAVHFGGGTPNMLSTDDVHTIFGALEAGFAWVADLDVAAEIDPAVLNRAWVLAMARHGLSRVSLGVQSLSPQVQKAVNRSDSIDAIGRAMDWLREAGVESINIDLMYGLPYQTTGDMLSTLDLVLPLEPERLALFGYAHVPWMKAHQRLIDESALPGAIERLEQSERAAERLTAAGYVQIGMDHFALPDDPLSIAQAAGRLHRNFQGYTSDAAKTLLGFGASAIGRLPQGFVQNAAQELAWREAVAQGRLPVTRGVAFAGEDRLRADIIERLMCDFAVDLAAVCARHAQSPSGFQAALDKLSPLIADGLVEVDGDRVRVTPKGRPLVRAAAAAFDAYLPADGARHAKAV